MKSITFRIIAIFFWSQAALGNVPSDFISIHKIDPSIAVEMRYATNWNFMGHVVTGYSANKCYLTKQAASALASVQTSLSKLGLGLLVFDCYRPQRAVAEFVKWTQDPKDQKMRTVFYPDEPKELLISRGYIASKSGHSRGSTVDLTVIKKTPTKGRSVDKSDKLNFQEGFLDCRFQKHISETSQLDMGTMFDCFSVLANTMNPNISKDQAANRKILLDAMEKSGFVNYDQEWWHYTLKDEPFKDTYFDFMIN